MDSCGRLFTLLPYDVDQMRLEIACTRAGHPCHVGLRLSIIFFAEFAKEMKLPLEWSGGKVGMYHN